MVVNVNTIVFQLTSSPSAFAKKSEITGEVLKSVQPIPIGNILKTFCCNNIPIFVPRNVAYKSLIFMVKGIFIIETFKSFLKKGRRPKMLPSNRISVVCNGFKSEFISTNRDKDAAITAHKTESKAKIKPIFLSSFDVIY